MIVIMSNKADRSTSIVMNWISYIGEKCVRINREDELRLVHFEIEHLKAINLIFELNGVQFSLEEIKSFWYRRGDIMTNNQMDLSIISDELLKSQVKTHLGSEYEVIRETVHYLLESTFSIGNKSNAHVNKLKVLMIANELGIDIPYSIVTTDEVHLEKFCFKNNAVITKSLSESPMLNAKNLNDEQDIFSMFTSEFSKEETLKTFFPSFLQEKLNKWIELRIFFLHGSFYPMAIFSQLDSQTSVDFRRYNHEKPNRAMAFALPQSIKNKLTELMNRLDLNTGSIDMVLTTNERYVLLEVNPVGQFGMVSEPCNYFLEKHIATILKN